MLSFQKKIKRKGKTYGRPIQQQQQQKVRDPKAAGSEKTIKQLLGELYGDRQYLEKLLKETGWWLGTLILNCISQKGVNRKRVKVACQFCVQGFKKNLMLSSAEHEILNAH